MVAVTNLIVGDSLSHTFEEDGNIFVGFNMVDKSL